MHRRSKLLTLLILATASSVLALGQVRTTYYTDPANGNDSNDGKTLTTAWKTLSFAGRQIGPGDTVLMRGGQYSNDHLSVFPRSTTEATPITLQAYQGETPILTGTMLYGTMAALAGSWVILDGLHIENTGGGIDLDIQSNNTIVRNCVFKNNPLGTFIRVLQTDHVTIEKSTFDTAGDRGNNGQGSAIYSLGSNHVLIQDNYFTRLGHAAVDIWQIVSGQVTYDVTGTIVRRNIVEQHWGGGLYCGGNAHGVVIQDNTIKYVGEQVNYSKAALLSECDGAIIRRNIVYRTTDGTAAGSVPGNSSNAIILPGLTVGGALQNSLNNRVYNNNVYKAGGSPLIIATHDVGTSTANKVINNIFFDSKTDCAASTGCQPDYWKLLGPFYVIFNFATKPAGLTGGNTITHNLIASTASKNDSAVLDVSFEKYTISHSLADSQAMDPQYLFENIEKAPMWKDPDKGDYALLPGSPAIGAGLHLAKTTAAGANVSVIPVDDPLWFTDGYGVIEGDTIRIGSQSVPVTVVDYAGKKLTVGSPVTFASGDFVDLQGSIDIGAVPMGSIPLPPAPASVTYTFTCDASGNCKLASH